jgi:hypothetical protein
LEWRGAADYTQRLPVVMIVYGKPTEKMKTTHLGWQGEYEYE